MSNISEKTINHLLTKVSDLEFEVERRERIINNAIEYIANNYPVCSGKDLLEILQDKKKEGKYVI